MTRHVCIRSTKGIFKEGKVYFREDCDGGAMFYSGDIGIFFPDGVGGHEEYFLFDCEEE